MSLLTAREVAGAPQLSPAAVALLNAVASVAPPTEDPWAKYPPVLTVDHIAEIMGRDRETVRRWARKGSKNGGLDMATFQGSYVMDQVEFRRVMGYTADRSSS